MRRSLPFLGLWLFAASGTHAEPPKPVDSVVKVLASVSYPNPVQPWTRSNPEEVSGTGVVIDGNRILTNAHLVLYATEVEVQCPSEGPKFAAEVAAVAPGVDLAILAIRDNRFFEGRPALPRATQLPKVQDNVLVYGFPKGGNGLAVTKGEVSRIEFGLFDYQGCGLLIQVSAAINSGNSGGPAVVGGRMIGLVLGRLPDAQNIGYLVPCEEIDLFLKDLEDGRYDGKPMDATGTEFQSLANEALRAKLNLGPKVKGVLVIPPRHHGADYPFQQFDVLTHIGDHEIDNEGMVARPGGFRVPFPNLIPRLAQDERVPVSLLRNGQSMKAFLPVTTQDNRLIREYRGEMPSYFIHGPLVFSPARAQAVSLYSRLNPIVFAAGSPLLTRRFDRSRVPGEELVVVTATMFRHKIAKGYRDPLGQVVTEVNGVKIKNLRHLVEVLRDSQDEYLTLCFAEEVSEILVFRRKEMEAATWEVLKDQGIARPRRGSEDMLAVWKKSKVPPR